MCGPDTRLGERNQLEEIVRKSDVHLDRVYETRGYNREITVRFCSESRWPIGEGNCENRSGLVENTLRTSKRFN